MISPVQTLTTSPEANNKKKNKENEKEIEPINSPLWIYETKQMLSFAWPVSIATIARVTMYNTDTAFLGHLGTSQLAGSAMANIVISAISSIIYCPGIALNSICSQAIGAGNKKIAGNWLQLALAMSLLLLIPCCVVLFFVHAILSPVLTHSDVLHFASLFARYAICFMIPTAIYLAIRQYFQSFEIVNPATIVSCTSVGVNILLNQIMIYGIHIDLSSINVHIHWHGLGFIGSPIATACSLTFQLTIFCIYAILYKKYPLKEGTWDGWTMESFKISRVKSFVKVMLPMMIGDATENWSYQVVILMTGSLPKCDVAANSVIFGIWGMLWSVFWGLGLATIVRVGKHIGNGDIYRTKLVIKMSLCLSIVCNGIISLNCYLFRDYISKLFTDSDDVILVLNHAIGVLAMLFFVGGIGWVGCSAMEGMSRNKERAYIYSITSWFLFVPSAVYFGIYSDFSKNGPIWAPVCLIWYCALVVEVLRCVLIWYMLLRTDWKKQVIDAKTRSEALIDKDDIDGDDGGDGGDDGPEFKHTLGGANAKSSISKCKEEQNISMNFNEESICSKNVSEKEEVKANSNDPEKANDYLRLN